MKKLLYLLFPAIILFASCQTQSGVRTAFRDYGSMDGVHKVTIPGWLLHLAGSLGDLDPAERRLLKSIDKVKVLTVEDPVLNARTDFHEAYYQKIRKSQGMEVLLTVRDPHEKVSILGMTKKGSLRELIILVSGEENVLVYLKGDFDQDMVEELSDLSRQRKPSRI